MSKAKFIEVVKPLKNDVGVIVKTNFHKWYILFNNSNLFDGVIHRYNKNDIEVIKNFDNSISFYNAIQNIVRNKNLQLVDTYDVTNIE